MQVESLAQLGVQLLLFHLGRELSFKKLRSVWSVALLGGSLQIVALMALGGLVAAAFNTDVMQVGCSVVITGPWLHRGSGNRHLMSGSKDDVNTLCCRGAGVEEPLHKKLDVYIRHNCLRVEM